MAASPIESAQAVEPEPSTTRKVVCAVIVAIIAVAVGVFVEWRSAAPPPPAFVPPPPANQQ
ncbi:MAG TPA: hypothetical protein VF614_06835 [Chthoniobacteraceae bacterium]|jgi:hypothetical protein